MNATPQAQPAPAVPEPVTYSSTQATRCACCGIHQHTPLRIDAMGGYVCLTCIDEKLGSLLGEFGYPEPAPASDPWRMAVDAAMVAHVLDCTTPDSDPKKCVALLCKQVADIWRDIAAPAVPAACWCETCRPITLADMRMVLCPTCGNKRCPHATDHRNACTNSNEPGQVGSSYANCAPAVPAVPDGIEWEYYDMEGIGRVRRRKDGAAPAVQPLSDEQIDALIEDYVMARVETVLFNNGVWPSGAPVRMARPRLAALHKALGITQGGGK